MSTQQSILTVALAAASYLLGAIPFALLVARYLYGVDIRTLGTGNIGAGNVRRQLGFGAGAIVMVADMLKGFLPALAAVLLLPPWPAALVALMPTVGHQFSVFLRGAGGKGIATAAGAELALSPAAWGITLGCWLIALSIKPLVKAAPAVAGATYLITSFLVPMPTAFRVLSVVVCALVLWKYRRELLRLRAPRARSSG